ncbi:MAG TPA: hypothetical protein VF843_07230 [Streptosporangiaceae bacterium]
MPVLQMFAFTGSALIVRHWFEIDLDDASMEHGARIELRELTSQPHRGSESAAQVVTADRPLWRADLFDRLGDQPGTFAVAHYHPAFAGPEPSGRHWDPALQADPWRWLTGQLTTLGAAGRSAGTAWPLNPADAADIPRYADQIVAAAQACGPDRCHSAAQCYQLTQDVRESVLLMIGYLKRPDRLDADWVRPWTSGT